MMRPLFIALLLCLAARPAYASGVAVPEELVLGVCAVVVASFAAALAFPSKFPKGIFLFFGGISGGAACCLLLLYTTISLSEGRPVQDAPGLLLPVTCSFASVAAVMWLSHRLRGIPVAVNACTKTFLYAFAALCAATVVSPILLSWRETGSTGFPPILIALVQALAILCGVTWVAGFFLRKKIPVDNAFRVIVWYWPFICLLAMGICQSQGLQMLGYAFWAAMIFGYPAAVTVFALKRLRAQKSKTGSAP